MWARTVFITLTASLVLATRISAVSAGGPWGAPAFSAVFKVASETSKAVALEQQGVQQTSAVLMGAPLPRSNGPSGPVILPSESPEQVSPKSLRNAVARQTPQERAAIAA